MAQPRRISFEDTRSSVSGGSATSEEDQNVEVVFDPSSPFRRKSSMVSRAGIPHHLRRGLTSPSRKTECLVHQLLESQRRTGGGRRRSHHVTVSDARHHHPQEDEGEYLRSVQASDDSSEKGLDRVVDPKGVEGVTAGAGEDVDGAESQEEDGAADTEEDAEDLRNDAGQADQKFWEEAEISREEAKSEPHIAVPIPAPATANNLTALHRSRDQHQQHPGMGVYSDETNSRLLTKKQLIEMAWGVRELSRRLGSMRLRFKVKTIFLMTKTCDDELIPKARAVARWLLSRERGAKYTVYVDGKLKEDRRFDAAGLVDEVGREWAEAGDGGGGDDDAGKRRLRYWDEDMCRARPQTFDFVITLGGDGTVLYASWLFQRIVPPVLSFALGSLGFLTKFDFEKYQQTLTSAFKEGVTVSLRLRFEATVMRSQSMRRRKMSRQGVIAGASTDGDVDGGGEGEDDEDKEAQRKRDLVEELIGEEKDDEHTHRPDGTFEVLNELVVDRGPNPTMSFTEIFGDDEYFTSILADGVCVSTPTGSTAYNLAAGGSLCHPENPVMLVTAICAHTLSFRPIILPDTIVLRIGVPYNARTSSWASFDGRERIELKQGDYVTISASRYPFAAVQVPGRRGEDWINSISAKLGWNTRQKQKPFKGEVEEGKSHVV